MARKPTDNGSATATAEPKPRQRKTPKQKAESLTVRITNAIESLAYMADKFSENQREAIDVEIQKSLNEMNEAFKRVGEAEEPRVFTLPD